MKAFARGRRVASGIGAALLCFALVGPAAATGPTANDLLHTVGFRDDAERRVLAGEFVSTDIKSSGERELAWAMAFLIKEPPSAVIQEVRGWLAVTADADTLSWGVIHGEGSPADFEKLKLERDAKKQVQAYLKAKPGSALNLDVSEIAAFNALQAAAKDDATAQRLVEQELRRSLLARYRAYRKSGLDGIAPYARSGGKARSPGAELRRAGEASSVIEKVMPSLHKVLLGYPKATAPKLEEGFYWSN
ncbi:MAG: hypothetical protein V3U03_04350, partial [Myxococcota bacterium]